LQHNIDGWVSVLAPVRGTDPSFRYDVIMTHTIRIVRRDIKTLDVDAVVNAAISALLGCAGVDGSIHSCQGLSFSKNADASADALPARRALPKYIVCPARWIIHTVGPVRKGGGRGEARLLASCYESSLKLAAEHNLASDWEVISSA
jgi:O-acetyl-ADP-ribose deacetylase